MYLFFTFSFLLFSSPENQNSVIIDGVAAVVGDDIVLMSDAMANIKPNLGKICILPEAKKISILKRLWRMSLETEISKSLLKVEAKKHNIFISSYRVNLAINELMKKNGLSSLTELKQRLKEDGISYKILRDNIKFQLLKSRLMADLVEIKVNVDDAAVKSYYLQKLREVKAEAKATIWEIFVPLKFKSTINLIKKDIAAKLPFKSIASKYNAKNIKATLKVEVTPGIYHPSIDLLLFPRNTAQKPPSTGSILGPIKTENGYYFIKIIDRQKSEYVPFEEVKDKLKKQLISTKMRRKSQEWLKSLRSKYLVDIHIPILPISSFCN